MPADPSRAGLLAWLQDSTTKPNLPAMSREVVSIKGRALWTSPNIDANGANTYPEIEGKFQNPLAPVYCCGVMLIVKPTWNNQ